MFVSHTVQRSKWILEHTEKKTRQWGRAGTGHTQQLNPVVKWKHMNALLNISQEEYSDR